VTQRVFYKKEMIIEAALEITREKGWNAVTARSIAAKLGSSTMPIYSSLKSMEEIEAAVREKAYLIMLEFQRKPYTDNPMLNVAIGYVAFARHEPRLFRFFFGDRSVTVTEKDARTQSDVFRESYGRDPAIRDAISQIPSSMQDPLAIKSWIFTHGLASMVANGVLNITDERIRELLIDAGGAFYIWDQQKIGKGGQQ
jgi:AcrR family transcriptional regulator